MKIMYFIPGVIFSSYFLHAVTFYMLSTFMSLEERLRLKPKVKTEISLCMAIMPDHPWQSLYTQYVLCDTSLSITNVIKLHICNTKEPRSLSQTTTVLCAKRTQNPLLCSMWVAPTLAFFKLIMRRHKSVLGEHFLLLNTLQ